MYLVVGVHMLRSDQGGEWHVVEVGCGDLDRKDLRIEASQGLLAHVMLRLLR